MSRFTLHGFHLSVPAYKVALAISMMGESFDFKPTNLRAGEHKKPEFIAINRFGQVPALEDKVAGFSLCQSTAMMEYLAGVTGKMGGSSPEEKVRVREWLYWSFDKLNAPIFRIRAQRFGFRSFSQSIAEMYVSEGALALDTVNKHLEGRAFMVGNSVTIADIEIYGAVSCAAQAGHSFATYPNIAAFIANFETQKGFKTALAFMPV
jgi:glutathione S-transferase